jgi:membrane dipeptidase
LHIPYFDAHCDTLSALDYFGTEGDTLRKNRFQNDLERHGKYSPSAQFFAIWGEAPDCFQRLYSRFVSELDALECCASFCRSAREAEKTIASGRTAMFLSVEGAQLIGGESGLNAAYDAGVRAITLTWNHANSLSGTNAEETERGLSDEGERFVRKCNELGVIVDLSHISDAGFWDAVRVSEKPIIASHSNSRAVFPHRRNLTDDMFRAVRDSGGTVGLNLYSAFVGEDPTVDDVLRHAEHFLNLGGERSLSLGCDFDGCDSLPRGINGTESIESLYFAFEKAFGTAISNDIFFNNLMRVVQQVCDM